MVYCNIAIAYYNGDGVERDEKKSKHYFELAAIGGDADERYNLGFNELESGNMSRALKHLMVAVEFGHNESLIVIKIMLMNKDATKDDIQAYLLS